MPLAAALFAPSALVGQGQGGEDHTACCFDLSDGDSGLLLSKKHFFRTPLLRLRLSPALLHKGGGSDLVARLDRSIRNKRANRCSA
jgi:hypothetical protein